MKLLVYKLEISISDTFLMVQCLYKNVFLALIFDSFVFDLFKQEYFIISCYRAPDRSSMIA